MNKVYGKELIRMIQTQRNCANKKKKVTEYRGSNAHENKQLSENATDEKKIYIE